MCGFGRIVRPRRRDIIVLAAAGERRLRLWTSSNVGFPVFPSDSPDPWPLDLLCGAPPLLSFPCSPASETRLLSDYAAWAD